MSLNNLRNYNWEQGTLSNPVSLTGTQFSWLINLLKKGTVTKDIRGYIQVGSHITSYEKYLVELAKDEHGQPLLHLVNPTVTPVEYTVVPQASTIKEGTSTKLNINGIGLEALKFRIVNHTNDTPDYQARTTIDSELGYVRVASAQENATWTDVVTIQACPVWEEWTDPNASIVEFDVTVNATAVTSVTITAPQYVKPGVTFNPIVNFLPVGHTKPIVNTLEDAAAKRGICFIPTSDNFTVGKTTDPTKMSAIAPNTETPVGETWSLGCGVYAFTNSQTMATPSANVAVKYPYIQFTVTTDGKFSDISTANPKITLQKVDSEDTPIGEPIILTGTVSGSSLVYTYGGGAGGNVTGDGSETYKVTFGDAPEGYRNIQQMTITPNQVITEISVQYVVKRPDLYFVYGDGDYEPLSAIEERGSFKSNKTRVGVAIVDENSSFLIKVPSESFSKQERLAIKVPGVDYKPTEIDAKEDFDNQRSLTISNNHIANSIDSAFALVYNYTVEWNEETIHARIPSYGNLMKILNNGGVINKFINDFMGYEWIIPDSWNPGCWTSTIEKPNYAWCISFSVSNDGQTNINRSSKLNTSDVSAKVIPIYPITL